MKRAVLLYDSDCGFCRWSVDKVLAWDRGGRVQSMELQDPEADSLLGGMEEGVKMSSWHFVTPDGRVYSAGAANVRGVGYTIWTSVNQPHAIPTATACILLPVGERTIFCR